MCVCVCGACVCAFARWLCVREVEWVSWWGNDGGQEVTRTSQVLFYESEECLPQSPTPQLIQITRVRHLALIRRVGSHAPHHATLLTAASLSPPRSSPFRSPPFSFAYHATPSRVPLASAPFSPPSCLASAAAPSPPYPHPTRRPPLLLQWRVSTPLLSTRRRECGAAARRIARGMQLCPQRSPPWARGRRGDEVEGGSDDGGRRVRMR